MAKETRVTEWVKEPISACLVFSQSQCTLQFAHQSSYFVTFNRFIFKLRREYVKVMKSRKGDRYGKKVWINLINAEATCKQCLPIFITGRVFLCESFTKVLTCSPCRKLFGWSFLLVLGFLCGPKENKTLRYFFINDLDNNDLVATSQESSVVLLR